MSMRRSDQAWLETEILPHLRGVERHMAGHSDGYKDVVRNVIDKIEDRIARDAPNPWEGTTDENLAVAVHRATEELSVDRKTRSLFMEAAKRLGTEAEVAEVAEVVEVVEELSGVTVNVHGVDMPVELARDLS